MAQDPPKRGSMYPIYGLFIGGGELDGIFCLIGTRHHRFTTQRQCTKVVKSIEQD